jgi:hypothetical protein
VAADPFGPAGRVILELAFAAGAAAIVTHNVRHFEGANRFGVRILTPGAFLRLLGEQK